jgi:hypothetical protein
MNPEEKSLLKTIFDLKSDLTQISMMDEFAKYAKIERRIIKLTEDRKKHREFDFV